MDYSWNNVEKEAENKRIEQENLGYISGYSNGSNVLKVSKSDYIEYIKENCCFKTLMNSILFLQSIMNIVVVLNCVLHLIIIALSLASGGIVLFSGIISLAITSLILYLFKGLVLDSLLLLVCFMESNIEKNFNTIYKK